MGKKLPYTTNSRIKSVLRKLFMTSKEHSAVLKRDGYTCVECGVKKSAAKGREQKVEVHHRNGVNNWEDMYSAIRAELLCNPDEMETLCPECHKKREI